MIPHQRQRYTERTGNAAAEVFAGKFPIGTPVLYYPVSGEARCESTQIRSGPWLLGDNTPVVKVNGRAGGVHIGHITAVMADSLATETRPCSQCVHYRNNLNGDYCSKKLMGLTPGMHVTFKATEGTCFQQ